MQDIEIIDHIWIPMPDGVRLAARLWRPRAASSAPVPAVFEYIPYRKADMVRARDERNHPFLAENGYAALRVDMRGSGDSEGVMPDMYSDDELSDARHIIAWIAAQEWCDGAVGMFGTSWGGTAALQANIAAPDALKAIIAVSATHDRYEHDIHHMGGCLLTDTLEWGATLPAILAAPPTPNVGTDWQQLWRARLEKLSFPLENWICEEARGRYWRHGSVIHEAHRLSRPILAIGGWADRYSASVMALASARPDLVSGVIGPWGHHYPDHAEPGPAIGFQQLALSWWDRWLRGHGDASAWPHLRCWVGEHEAPRDRIKQRAGRWVETGPLTDCTERQSYSLSTKGLQPVGPVTGSWTVPGDLRVGLSAGDTGYFGRAGGLPQDQAEEDANSLCFDTEPFDTECTFYGVSHLRLETTARKGQIIARLTDVAPDGVSVLISRTVRNLALNEALDPLTDVAAARQVNLPFPAIAYRLRKGHQLRLSLSSSYWPLIWPAPEDAAPEIRSGVLDLSCAAAPLSGLAAPFPEPLDLPPVKTHRALAAPALTRTHFIDANGQRQDGWHQPRSDIHFDETETRFGFETSAYFEIDTAAASSAKGALSYKASYARPDGTAHIASWLSITSDGQEFAIEARLTAEWNGEPFATRDWSLRLPRILS